MHSLVIFAAAVLFVQGILVYAKRSLDRHVRSFGVLTIVLAALVLVAYLLFVRGPLVFSREFGYVLAGGEGTHLWLGLLLLGTAVVAGLGWRIARIETGATLSFPWYLSTGVVIGILSAASIGEAGSSAATSAKHDLYYYDVWSPPLALWVSACLAGAILSVLRWQRRIELWPRRKFSADVVQLCAIFSAASILAFAAVSERSAVFDDYLLLWNTILLAASSVAVATARLAAGADPKARWRIAGYFAAGIVPAGISVYLPERALTLGLGLWALVMLAALRTLAAPLKSRLLRRLEQTRGEKPAPDAGGKHVHRFLIAFLIAIMGFSLTASVLNLGTLDIAITVILFFVSWAVLSDVLYENGIFVRLWRILLTPSRLLERTRAVADALVRALGAVLGRIGKALSADTWYGGAFKVFLGVVLIVWLAELPNSGRAIVMPFKVSSELGDGELGEQLSNRVVHELKSLSRDLSREIALSISLDKPSSLYAYDLSGSDDVLAKSGSIELPGGLKLPVELLVWPIRAPARWLLDVNVISGSVVKNESGYEMMATSSRGDGWHIVYPPPSDGARPEDGAVRQAVGASAPVPTGASQSAAGAEQTAGEPQADGSETAAQRAPDGAGAKSAISSKAIDYITRKLAFEILLNTPESRFDGVTRDWDAYVEYSAGVEKLNHYLLRDVRSYRHGTLKQAIEHLLTAAARDPASSRIHYRLGLAMQADGQLYAARDAYQRSLEADPQFVAAKVALAVQRMRSQAIEFSLPPGAVERKLAHDPAAGGDHLWSTVIDDPNSSLLDLATAYEALAFLGFETLSQTAWSPGKKELWYRTAALSAYYNARRAIRSYEELSSLAGRTLSVIQAYARALNLAGVILDSVAREWTPVPYVDWTCIHGEPEAGVGDLWIGPYTRDSIKYYQAASEQTPGDPVILCNAAIAALSAGDTGPMERLRSVAAVRKHAGDQILKPENLPKLIQKLREYDTAILIDPSDIASLNAFAYAYYDYRRQNPVSGADAAQLLDFGLRAEQHAREAIRKARLARKPESLIYEGTLGEVLMAMHRFEEAAAILESLEIPDHPSFFEMKWDLAQTYSCMAAATKDDGYLVKAQELFSEIRRRDLDRHTPLFGDASIELDALMTHPLCLSDGDYSLHGDTGLQIDFEVIQEEYNELKPCDRSVLRVWAPEPERLAVRVWGKGIHNFRIVPEQTHTVYTVLSWEPRSTVGSYFVRLYQKDDAKGVYDPVSSVKVIDTFADCKRNTIDLWYERRLPATMGGSAPPIQ